MKSKNEQNSQLPSLGIEPGWLNFVNKSVLEILKAITLNKK